MGVVGIRSVVEVDWFRLPVVYRLGDGWVALYGVVLSWVVWWVSWWGDGLGYEFLCHDVGLGYGVCSLVGFFGGCVLFVVSLGVRC